MRYDVFGMCNALFDLQAEVDDSTLTELNLEKGSMVLLDEEQQRSIVPRIYTHLVNTEAGGSGANTMFGVALLGGTACYTSRVGSDEHAQLYRQGLEAKGVKPNLGSGEGATGVSLIFVTPDAQRTMCTYLGRSRELTAADVNLEDLRQSRYLYVTAYLWDTDNQKEAVLHAMREANRAGVRVALSLSDPFCVHRHKDELLELIRNHVDVLFGNWHEAQTLTDTETPRDAVRALAQYSDVAVVTMDEKGSLLQQGEQVVEVPVYPVTPVDTTGAGDMYAAGILYGLTQGYSLEVTGRIAAYAAAQVVAKLGPRLEEIDEDVLRRLRTGADLTEI
ncbi:MAG: adenosine kinase [Armatimonadota bacterium]